MAELNDATMYSKNNFFSLPFLVKLFQSFSSFLHYNPWMHTLFLLHPPFYTRNHWKMTQNPDRMEDRRIPVYFFKGYEKTKNEFASELKSYV